MKCKCVLAIDNIVLALRNTMQILQKQGDLSDVEPDQIWDFADFGDL